MAGIALRTAIEATPRTPHRTLSRVIESPFLVEVEQILSRKGGGSYEVDRRSTLGRRDHCAALHCGGRGIVSEGDGDGRRITSGGVSEQETHLGRKERRQGSLSQSAGDPRGNRSTPLSKVATQAEPGWRPRKCRN